MSYRTRSTRVCVLTPIIWLAIQLSPTQADDYILTVGGGYAPTGNQASLENNVLFFQRLVGEKYGEQACHDIYFSDGDCPEPDLQFKDPNVSIPTVNRLLAEVFGKTDQLEHQYRSHAVKGLRGGSSVANLKKWFDETGSKLPPGDRLLLYFTGHGGRSTDKKQPHNTCIYLWNREKLLMKDLVAELDKLPAGVSVVMIMVQCYTGGFSHIIFEQGDIQKGPAAADRCGFFATVHDRPAAGCTPDIVEADYREYSTYFFAALTGQTRSGEPVEAPDYDGDGAVSFAEAHAYALLTSTTIDVSVTTSDAFLRACSKMQGKGHDDDMKTPDAPLAQLMERATPAQQHVLRGLSEQLGLTQDKRAREARELAKRLEKEKKEIESERKKKTKERDALRARIRRRLLQRWPVLDSRWHPQVSSLLENESDEIVQLIEAHPDFEKLKQLNNQVDQLQEREDDRDRTWARCQRLIRTLENVALAANLPQVADAAIQQRYRQLVALESSTFGPAPAKTVVGQTETKSAVPGRE